MEYRVDDRSLSGETFLDFVQQVWPGAYNLEQTRAALSKTMNFTAWDGGQLAGCLRVLTDGCFFGTITELLVLPLIVAVTLIQWVGIFFTQFSTVIFNLLAGLMFLITIAGWMFGISAGAETLRLLAVAFVVFIIPHIAEWLIIRIAVINYGLRDFIKS